MKEPTLIRTLENLKRSIKEVLRHSILKSGLNGQYLALRARRGQNVEHLRAATIAERFSAIYRNRVWLNEGAPGSLSGFGSELANTISVRRNLPILIESLNTRCLLDLGCGDFNWMRDVPLPCDYIGADCVQSVIETISKVDGNERRRFICLDATTDRLPSADTVLCREIFFHLSFKDLMLIVNNIRISGASFLIATTDPSTLFNSDILSGDFRMLNLTKGPLHFPNPDLSIPDDDFVPGRMLAVWKVSRLPVFGK